MVISAPLPAGRFETLTHEYMIYNCGEKTAPVPSHCLCDLVHAFMTSHRVSFDADFSVKNPKMFFTSLLVTPNNLMENTIHFASFIESAMATVTISFDRPFFILLMHYRH